MIVAQGCGNLVHFKVGTLSLFASSAMFAAKSVTMLLSIQPVTGPTLTCYLSVLNLTTFVSVLYGHIDYLKKF